MKEVEEWKKIKNVNNKRKKGRVNVEENDTITSVWWPRECSAALQIATKCQIKDYRAFYNAHTNTKKKERDTRKDEK